MRKACYAQPAHKAHSVWQGLATHYKKSIPFQIHSKDQTIALLSGYFYQTLEIILEEFDINTLIMENPRS